MKYNPDIHDRQSTRLRGFDYSTPGKYFVTICTERRECVLGEIEGNEMKFSRYGEIVREQWFAIMGHFPGIHLDSFVIMPNHIHGIIVIGRRGEVTSTLRNEKRITLGNVVAYFKYQATKKVNAMKGTPAAKLWQRNYFDRIIRSENELNKVRTYIRTNPANWSHDRENPMRAKTAKVETPIS